LRTTERENVIGGGARSRRRLKYRARVVLKDFEILRDILRVIGTRVVRDAEIGAKERGEEFEATSSSKA